MIAFDPNDPFPLLAPDSHSYREAQEHSALVDSWLGLSTEAIERELSATRVVDRDNEQAWIGLPIQTLQTPYTELREIVERLKTLGVRSVVDLGAGYGRLGFVISRHGEGMTFTGYELVEARVEEARRRWTAFGVERSEIYEADLESASFAPIAADAA